MLLWVAVALGAADLFPGRVGVPMVHLGVLLTIFTTFPLFRILQSQNRGQG